MNERIRQLYYECQDESQSTEQCYQQFAKLIVRECAEQSMSIGRYNTPSGVTPDLSIAIAVGLKKHFGVEEQATEPSELHTCPYAEEIHGDYETLCDCDEEKQHQCRMDI